MKQKLFSRVSTSELLWVKGKIVFRNFKEIVAKKNRERMKDFKFSEETEMHGFISFLLTMFHDYEFQLYIFFVCIIVFPTIFMILLKKFWMKSSHNKGLWNIIRGLGYEGRCCLVIIQRRSCGWHFWVILVVEGRVIYFSVSDNSNWYLSNISELDGSLTLKTWGLKSGVFFRAFFCFFKLPLFQVISERS